MKQLCLLTLLITYSLFAQEQIFKPVSIPEGYTSQLDVIYKQVNGWEGRMDLYANMKSTKPTPVVINIHGGGWNHREKESQSGFWIIL